MIPLYYDVYFQEEAQRLVFGNSKIRMEFDAVSGKWLVFRQMEGQNDNLIHSNSLAADVRVNGEWLVETKGTKLLRHEIVGAKSGAITLRLLYGIGDDTQYELRCDWTLRSRQKVVERTLQIARKASSTGDQVHLEGFRFLLPGPLPGPTADCVVDAPGPWFPRTYLSPNSPYTSLAERLEGKPLRLHSAPDAGFGLLAITDTRQHRTLATWLDTAGGEVNDHPTLQSEGGFLSFLFEDHRDYRLLPGMSVLSDVQQITLTDGLSPALRQYREMVTRTMPPDPKTPAWVRDAVIMEAYPDYYPGGLKELTERLPFYQKVGINTLYLMPHWRGGYMPIDPFAVEPKIGTPADLKAMVAEAHRLGMKVLFDMVIHGLSPESPYLTSHPEIFCHDVSGKVAQHPTWRSMTTDWGSPAYQKFMVDLVLHDQREYDNDGYRVDAASYKGPNWDAKLAYPAHRSGTAAPELMAKMLTALRRKRPEAVLLNEVFGPVFHSVSNFSHDNQAEAAQQFLERMEQGEATAHDYKLHIANVQEMLPPGANRVYYTRNHDTSWFYHFNGYTPRFLAMEALHALTAIPEIFSGDRGHPHTPDEKLETFAYYTKLFALRKRFPELTHGELLLREVECDSHDVFTALRQSGENTSLVVINLSEKEQKANVMTSLLSGGKTEMTLTPFSVTVCRLNLRGEIVETVLL